jgi:hypothetical protein
MIGSALFEDLTVLLSVLLLSCKKEFWIESETSSGLALVGYVGASHVVALGLLSILFPCS